MTRLINDASEFAAQALAGYVAAHADRVLGVPGGVVRSTKSQRGQVAIVMGGGSGHFPAFAGWVGPGFGHGAACGNIFASPSEAQIVTVARAAHSGGGILFAPINYTGDILHFRAAAETLRAEGIDVRMVAITDDIASGSTDGMSDRRGIAGAFAVLKITGAAAERGDSLDDVQRVIVAANEATRTLGVAFDSCTLPGSAEPLFTLPAGRIGLGLGIHGEPGVAEADLGPADNTADLLVDGLFVERAPVAGQRVAVLVNGLGATKYDELFVIFGRVRARLKEVGMVLVAPVVGEQVTSLDMAGASVSFTYLDAELEELWLAPADVASFSRGSAGSRERRSVDGLRDDHNDHNDVVVPGSTASAAAASMIAELFDVTREVLVTEEQRLGRIDAVAGDGDHGAGMLRGITAATRAANDAVARGAGIGTVLHRSGLAWSNEGGGTSGALWGAGLSAAGDAVGDEHVQGAELGARAVRAFTDEIRSRGGARVGEKTMVDAIVPFTDELERAIAEGGSFIDAWRTAAAKASSEAATTAQLVSSRGRSRIHGERSRGTPDAGATSFAIIVSVVGESASKRWPDGTSDDQ